MSPSNNSIYNSVLARIIALDDQFDSLTAQLADLNDITVDELATQIREISDKFTQDESFHMSLDDIGNPDLKIKEK